MFYQSFYPFGRAFFELFLQRPYFSNVTGKPSRDRNPLYLGRDRVVVCNMFFLVARQISGF